MAAVAVLAAGTAAFASGAAVPVSLKITAGSAGLEVGQAARLTATAKLPKGARLLIQAFRPSRGAAKVVECLRSPCSGSYRASQEGSVTFQASAIKRAGGKLTTLGKSKRVEIFWTAPELPPPPEPAPPPQPAPAAAPGHYAGKTADNELWAFDVGADGLSLTNLRTGQINQHCEPPAYLSRGEMEFPGPIPLTRDGNFTINNTLNGTVGTEPSTVVIKITGRVAGGSASGTYRVDTSFSYQGQGYGCTSGDQTWTASKA